MTGAATWTVALKGGEKLVVPATLDNFSTYMFLEIEDWFEMEVDFIRRLVRPGFRALDVGANLGFYTIAMARRAGPEGKIWAFEPDGSVAALIRESVAANGLSNITIVEAALGERTGKAVLHAGDSPEFNTVEAISPEATAGIDMLHLDDFGPKAGMAGLDFIKLDAEGMEGAILSGGKEFFQRESPLIMSEILHSGQIQTDLLSRFQELGYRLWRYAPGLDRLIPLVGDDSDYTSLNIFACKDDRARKLAAEGRLIAEAATTSPVHHGAFAAFYGTTGFGRRFLSEAGDMAAWFSAPHVQPYRDALDLYARSRDAALDGPTRLALLWRAYHGLSALVSQLATAPRLFSLVRMARDLGLTLEAAGATNWIVKQMSKGAPLDLDEPFLALSTHFENAPPGVPLASWTLAMTFEYYGRQNHVTTKEHPDFAGMVEHIIKLGLGTPELERRRQVFRIASRLQEKPEVTGLLASDPGATLNWGYWRGSWG